MNTAIKYADKFLGRAPTIVPPHPLLDEDHPMHALVWMGTKDVRYVQKPRPLLTDPRDIILRVTATTICGSDLHLYSGMFPGMKEGDILGHEFLGIIEEVGSEVKHLKKGQRVVVAFDIACGSCEFCKREEYSACDMTNPSKVVEKIYGHRPAAFYGYSHLTGGIPGGQAEYVRVPLADFNCLPIPDDIPDDKALYLSDIIPTSFFGTELGGVKEGLTVAIWGLGPIGLLTARWCQLKRAKRIIGIDCIPERLAVAKKLGIEVINFKKEDVVDKLHQLFPTGLDVCIECTGFEYAKSLTHRLELTLRLESDSADIFNEMFCTVRKFGTVAVLGVYCGTANHFPVGALMEKGLTVKSGQCPTQKYWKMCLEKIRSGEMDPSFIVTHRGSLSDGPEFYKKFYKDRDLIKCFMRPATFHGREEETREREESTSTTSTTGGERGTTVHIKGAP